MRYLPIAEMLASAMGRWWVAWGDRAGWEEYSARNPIGQPAAGFDRDVPNQRRKAGRNAADWQRVLRDNERGVESGAGALPGTFRSILPLSRWQPTTRWITGFHPGPTR